MIMKKEKQRLGAHTYIGTWKQNKTKKRRGRDRDRETSA